ncbi:MAG TPA: hypothetical protein VHD63_24060 [Ktedonobacteraceae bacterium]|nr:hypothetical protein [Ktedonobacteraceae bacterium]
MANVATTSKGEIISVTEADQFQPAKSQYECGFFACAMARTMSRPGEPPTQSAATVIANAEQWYAQYDGNNNASNTAGMTDEQEYELLHQIGLHYQALPLDITLVKQWISWGYPVLLAVTETSVHDLTLDGANPYPWTPSGNHMILATGLGSGNSLLVRDSANVTSLFNNTSLRPGPRLYDASRLQLVSATIAVPPWRPRPASATALPTADMQIPAGWRDDGDKLTAPNGVSVVLGFRHWILSHRWNPADVPLAPEAGANPVELGEAQPGTDQDGTRLITMYNELCWTKARGVWLATVGRELWTLLTQHQPATPVPASVTKTSAGGGPAEPEETEAQAIKRDLLAAARLIGDTATHLLERARQLA